MKNYSSNNYVLSGLMIFIYIMGAITGIMVSHQHFREKYSMNGIYKVIDKKTKIQHMLIYPIII